MAERKGSADSKEEEEPTTDYNNPDKFAKYIDNCIKGLKTDGIEEEAVPQLSDQHKRQFKDGGLTMFSDVRYLTDDDFKEMGLTVVALRQLQHTARRLQAKHVKRKRELAVEKELKDFKIKDADIEDVKNAMRKTIKPDLQDLEGDAITKKEEEVEVSLSSIGALGDDAFDSVKLKRVEFRKLQHVGQEKNKITTLKLSNDIYDAVVAAAFGSVIVRLPGSRGSVPLHPFVIFIFTGSLFVAQYTLLTCLLLDVEVDDKGDHRWWVQTWDEFNKMPGRRILLVAKVIMTLILQMIVMKELMGGLRPLFFVCNPYTWVEVKRPILKPFRGGDCGELEMSDAGNQSKKRGLGDAYSVFWCLPFCILSEMCQLIIAYGVLNLSMSVILNCGKVSDVVLNGLAITFVIDLDEHAWSVLAPLLHIDERYYEDHEIETLEDYEAQEMIDNMHKKGLLSFFFSCLEMIHPDFHVWFHRSNGGKVQLIENFLQVILLPLIFLRQVVVFVRAMQEGTLPLSKDICGFIRMNHDQSPEIKWIDTVVPFNFSLALENLQERDGFKHIYNVQNCTSSDLEGTPVNYFPWLSKFLFLPNDYQCKTQQVVLGVLIVFVFPQIVYGFARQVQMTVGFLFPPKYTRRQRPNHLKDGFSYRRLQAHFCDSETEPLADREPLNREGIEVA